MDKNKIIAITLGLSLLFSQTVMASTFQTNNQKSNLQYKGTQKLSPLNNIDNIKNEQIFSQGTKIIVNGWAINKNGIKRAEIFINGKKVGEAKYGLVRNDIGKIYSQYKNSKYSGFKYTLDTSKLNIGKNVILFSFIGNSGDYQNKQVYFNIIKNKNKTDIVIFKDKNLEKVVRDILKKPIGNITQKDASKITKLEAINKGITDINGIENLSNLQILNLSNNKIKDFTPISELNKTLLELNLTKTGLKHVSFLKDFYYLKSLTLQDNLLTSDSYINISNGVMSLEYLNLKNNEINAINNIHRLNTLKKLNVEDNPMGIESINKLKAYLYNCQILY